VADARESPALEIAARLIAMGASLSYHDPHVPHVMVAGSRMDSVALDAELLRASDSVVVATAHGSYDWPWVLEHSRLVVDTRNATRDVAARRARVVKL
jgi:UDP-N-acetyl-D-glucosamine dehydrogenase